jgi:hypothetical protein
MTQSANQSQTPLTDSPWFWLYAFCTFGLAALTMMNNRYQQRQFGIERQYQARERAFEIQGGMEPTTEVTGPDNLVIRLNYLYVVLGLLLVGGWARLWWQRFRPTIYQHHPET